MSSSIFRILLVGLLSIAAAFAVEWMPADRPLPCLAPDSLGKRRRLASFRRHPLDDRHYARIPVEAELKRRNF